LKMNEQQTLLVSMVISIEETTNSFQPNGQVKVVEESAVK